MSDSLGAAGVPSTAFSVRPPDLSNDGVRAWWERFGRGAFPAIMAAERSEGWTSHVDEETVDGLARLCLLGARDPGGCAELLADDANLLRLRKILASIPAALRIRVMQHLAEAEALPPGSLSRLMDEAIPEGDDVAQGGARVLTRSVLAMHQSWLLGQILDEDRRRLARESAAAAAGDGRHAPQARTGREA